MEYTNIRIANTDQIDGTKILFPELSYQVVGALFDVSNDLGYGHMERVYQRAVAKRLQEMSIPFKEQVYAPVTTRGYLAGRNYLDFLVDGKLILELKRGPKFIRTDTKQVYAYLRVTKITLGILATFTPSGVEFLRIINLPKK